MHASVERLAEPRDALIHDGRGLSGARADAAVEVVDVRAHRLGNFLGALAQALNQFAAIDLHGAVEFAEMLGYQPTERLGVARAEEGERHHRLA